MRDRGTMKWTSLMLPEHVQALRKIWNDVEQKEMPILDEQQMADNSMKLQIALENDGKIKIKHFANNEYITDEGYLLSVDTVNAIIFMEDMDIKFENIIEVNVF